MRERQREGRVANKHGTRRAAADFNRADRQTEQRALHLHLDDVAALAHALDEILGIAGFRRAERADVVGRA